MKRQPMIPFEFICLPAHLEYTTTMRTDNTILIRKDPYTEEVNCTVDLDFAPFDINQ